jgi:hypothetical protein
MRKQGLPPFSPSRVLIIVEGNMRLFIVFVRTILLYKSRAEISFREEGYDTTSVTIAATLFLQYLCSVSWFKFKFEFKSFP